MSLTIRATYENGRALPIGTLVELTGCTRNRGTWNGNRHIKTGDAVWAVVHHGATPEELAAMVERRQNNISPGPSSEDGSWIIVNPDVVFAGLIASVQASRRAAERAEQRGRSAARRLEDILSFVNGDVEWAQVEDEN